MPAPMRTGDLPPPPSVSADMWEALLALRKRMFTADREAVFARHRVERQTWTQVREPGVPGPA